MSGPGADHGSNSNSSSSTVTETITDSYNSTVNRVNNVSNSGNFYLGVGAGALDGITGGGEAEAVAGGFTPKQLLIGSGVLLLVVIIMKFFGNK
jgi:hypothetical protein